MSKITIYQVPSDPIFQDFDDDSPDIFFHRNRYTYWAMIKEERELDPENFLQAVEKKYGIKPIKLYDGSFTDKYEIVNQQAYLAYLLKYGVK